MENGHPENDFVIIHRNDAVDKSDHGLVREFGVSGTTSRSQHLSIVFGIIPLGTKSTRHYHPFETALYVLSGSVRAYFGPNEEHGVEVAAGDFLYIPAGMIHSTENIGNTPVEYILARAAAEDEAISADADAEPDDELTQSDL